MLRFRMQVIVRYEQYSQARTFRHTSRVSCTQYVSASKTRRHHSALARTSAAAAIARDEEFHATSIRINDDLAGKA